ncbi:MAG: hypothetical protein LBQ63_01800 [Deltaproteobacteria bacterium]|nr:hypothetical protein [Deltaproteobacteria bacterium]
MKKYIRTAFFSLILLSPRALAADNLERLDGYWQCDAESAIELMRPGIGDEKELDMLREIFAAIGFSVAAKDRILVLSAAEENETSPFAIVSDAGETLVLIKDDEETLVITFEGDDRLILTEDGEKTPGVPFRRVK